MLNHDIRGCELSNLFFSFALAVLGLLSFHIKFRIRMSISTKYLVILIGTAINLQTNLGRTVILTILSLLEILREFIHVN